MNRESESPSRPEIIPIRKTIPARSELEETLTQTIGAFRGALLDHVKGGETVVIIDDGVPVAHLGPAVASSISEAAADEARSSRLVAEEMLTRPTRGPLSHDEITALFSGLLGKPPSGVLEALLEERRDGDEVLGQLRSGAPAGPRGRHTARGVPLRR